MARPNPVQWLWYAMGGGLPRELSAWVLHDTTTRTWGLRHIVRALVQLAVPIAVVLLVVPGPFWIRAMAALGGLIMGLIFSIAYMPETTEHRVVKAGYPAGTAERAHAEASRLREQEDSRARRAAAARRAERYRARNS